MAVTINASTSAGLISTADTSGILQLQTANTTALTINASQNVGIGTSSPTTKLTIGTGTYSTAASGTTGMYTTATGLEMLSDSYFFGDRTGSTLMHLISTGNLGIGTSSPSTKLAVAGGISGTGGLNISGGGWGVLPYVANSLVIDNNGGEARFFATGANATTDGSFLFYTGQTDGGANERARITSVGSFIVGATAEPNGTTGGSAFINTSFGRKLLVIACTTTSNANLAEFANPNGVVGSIATNGSATAYNTSSDYRLKNTIAPITGALDKVALLKPCTYKWNVDGKCGQGFIAHELAEIAPQCVSGEKDEVDEQGNPKYQGIDVSFLVATLTAAIQEQQAIIETLKADVAALKG
jgi:hypothetical protein